MGQLRLFRLKGSAVNELEGRSVAKEKTLQNQIEHHMDEFLDVRFLASEHPMGEKLRGRIDSLGLDKDRAPVIFEYKRSSNDNVITQGLYYMDWLRDHQADFTLLVQEKLGPDEAKDIEWEAIRLICIAREFSRYDEHAVQQIERNIELIRYGYYGDDLLALEQVNVTTAPAGEGTPESGPSKKAGAKAGKNDNGSDPYAKDRIKYKLAHASPAIKDLYTSLHDHLMDLGDDVVLKELRLYHAFRRIRNFACVVFSRRDTLEVYMRIDPATIKLEQGFTRNVKDVGHWGTGDLRVRLKTAEDLQRAAPLLKQAYENA
jgi:predicted transport protein